MNLPPQTRSRNSPGPSKLPARRLEEDLLEAVSGLWDAANSTLLDVARAWCAAKAGARPDELLITAVDVLEFAGQLLGRAFQHAAVVDADLERFSTPRARRSRRSA